MRLWFLLASLALSPFASGQTAFDDALALYRAAKYPEARAAFETLIAADPQHAAACYYLGMTLRRRGDDRALDDAVVWLEKASQLEPNNPRYLADYGGTSLQIAAKRTSFSAATRGRDALERSLELEPGNIDARIGLMQFYTRAPWPLGSKTKARAQLDAIRQLNPARALAFEATLATAEKNYAAAFQLCEEALARNPDDYHALYHYGRTASLSGENLARGLERLERCAALPEPGPPAPSHSEVWNRIGLIREKLAQPDRARVAYQTALALNPGNRSAAEALARLE